MNSISCNHKHWRIIKKRIDFVLPIGDDLCDKQMLYVIRQIGHSSKEACQSRDDIPQQPLPATITRRTRRDDEKANDSE